MKAFLLAAGRGERLRPLTDTTPKCLLPINGTPLLKIWLSHLEQSGFDEVLINTHWLHEAVESYVREWSSKNRKMKIRLFYEPVLLGSGGTILANRKWAGKDPFYIIYGDNLTRINLLNMLAVHRISGLPLTIRVYEGADPSRAGIVCIDENDIVIDFEEKPDNPKSDLGAGGIYIADDRIFEYFPRPDEMAHDAVLDLSYHVLPRLAGCMKAYNTREFSIDIGSPGAYEKAQEIWPVIQATEAC